MYENYKIENILYVLRVFSIFIPNNEVNIAIYIYILITK